MTKPPTRPLLPIVGWQESARFPEWKNIKMKAKVDTGAKSAAIHAEMYSVTRLPSTHARPVNEEIKMKLKVGPASKPKYVLVTAPIVDWRNVKNSGGKTEERPFIETQIKIGDYVHSIVMSVTNREKMRFPVLLGRDFLAGKFLVDPHAVRLM